MLLGEWVPNAPCGVESYKIIPICVLPHHTFLMHRVELKVVLLSVAVWCVLGFLMHRVELKGILRKHNRQACSEFLMHRVELKAFKGFSLLGLGLGS